MTLKQFLQTHKKSHIIFDLDETLVFLELPWDSWERNIEDKLYKIESKIISDYKKLKINLSTLENLYISKHPQAKRLIIEHSIKFEKALKKMRVNQKLVNFIKNANGYIFYLWSSNTKPTIEKSLKKTNLINKFQKIISREDVTFLKPELDGFKKIYDNKIPKSKYLLVGDSPFDEQATKNAGIDYFKIEYFNSK